MAFTPTNRPVPSDAPEDLYFNSAKLDEYVNSPEPSTFDRTGVERLTFAGVEQASADLIAESSATFQAFMNSIGRVDKGAYAAGIVLNTRSDVFYRNGFYYRAAPGTPLPYTTTGVWASESANFIIDFGPTNLVPQYYGAQGDGVTNDDAAFASLQATLKGCLIDLGGKAYAVSSVPTGNTYINGRFIVSGFNVPAVPYNSPVSMPPKFHGFGNALRELKERLADPLCQFIGLTGIGDSNMWGVGASGTSPGTGFPTPDRTLSDIRAMYGAPTFFNQIKRYIRDNYKKGEGFTEIVSNWPASPAGESTVLYQNTELLYPRYGQFAVAQIGASQAPTDLTTNNSPSGMILSLNNTVGAEQYGHSISFPFTGTKFILSVRTSAGGVSDAFIDVLVNGVLVPEYTAFSVQPGNNGLVDNVNNYDQQLEITIPFVKDGTVMIRSNRNGLSGNRLLSVTALRVPRQIRITNNGISGTTTVSYKDNNLDGNASGDGVAIVGTDMIVMVLLGANDRAWTTGRPRGSNQYEVNLNALLDNASFTGKKVILIAANPSSNEDPATYPFHMQEVRNINYRVAKARSMDMLDNYSIFLGMDPTSFTADGLHLNDLGHSMAARNFINALEQA